METNEARQIYDSLSDEKKKELEELVEYPILLTTLIKHVSAILKTSIAVIHQKSKLDELIVQKILTSCDGLDNTGTIIDLMIKNENEKFLTESKKSEDTDSTDTTE